MTAHADDLGLLGGKDFHLSRIDQEGCFPDCRRCAADRVAARLNTLERKLKRERTKCRLLRKVLERITRLSRYDMTSPTLVRSIADDALREVKEMR